MPTVPRRVELRSGVIRAMPHYIRDYPATMAVLGVLMLVYTCQLVLAGSLRSGAGYEIANSLSSFSYLVLNPWLHSDHLHLVENAVVFAILGWWAERRTDPLQLGIFVVLTGYITNLVPPLFGGGFGVGASGITNGLWAFSPQRNYRRISLQCSRNPSTSYKRQFTCSFHLLD